MTVTVQNGGGCTGDCGGTGTLIVVTNVVNTNMGVLSASNFTDTVTGTNVLPSSTIVGSASGTTVTLTAGTYSVAQDPSVGYDVSYSADCTGSVAAGQTETCTVTDQDKSLPAPVCTLNGLYGYYYNLPETLPGMNGTALATSTPSSTDWYTSQFLSFASNTAITSFDQTSDFFPVDDGLPGDPFYTAIHWTGWVTFPASGTYPITLGSDDDSWLYINGQLADSVPGIHPLTYATSSYTVTAGETVPVDLYFAEREPVQSALVFQMPGVTFSPCGPVVIPVANLSITKTVDNAAPTPGATINYTLTVDAQGPATSTGVVATDTLPSGLTFENATASVGSYATSTGTWTIGDMTPSSTATLDIAALVEASDTVGMQITNTGIVGETPSSTNQTGNSSSSVTVTVTSPGCTSNCGGGAIDADIAVAKTADVTSTQEGGTINYTITVTANGPSTSTDVMATDTLPTGLTFVSRPRTGFLRKLDGCVEHRRPLGKFDRDPDGPGARGHRYRKYRDHEHRDRGRVLDRYGHGHEQ